MRRTRTPPCAPRTPSPSSTSRSNLDLRLDTIQRMLIWLAEELERQRQKLTASEQALTEYRSGQDAFSLDDRQNLVTARLNALNEALTRARTARLQKETLYTQVRSAVEGPDPANALPAAARERDDAGSPGAALRRSSPTRRSCQAATARSIRRSRSSTRRSRTHGASCTTRSLKAVEQAAKRSTSPRITKSAA